MDACSLQRRWGIAGLDWEELYLLAKLEWFYIFCIGTTKSPTNSVKLRSWKYKTKPMVSHFANATVSIKTESLIPTTLWTRLDAEALTDGEGRWQSPPMHKNSRSVRINVAHAFYNSGERSNTIYTVPAGLSLSKGKTSGFCEYPQQRIR